MKLTVKTLQGVAFAIEAELTDTVLSVKAKIEQQNGSAVDQQKLIHAGKVLKDESALSEYNIKENDFLVVMVTKPKVAKKPAATTPAPAPAATPVAAPVATPAAPAVVPPTTAASTPAAPTPVVPAAPAATQPAAPAAPAANAGIAGQALDSHVQQLCEMGFPEDQVRLALQAAFNNPDRAVEYLMNGIPDTRHIPVSGAPTSSTPAAPSSGASFASANTLEALRNHPQFDALRRLIQSNPSSLPVVLQQIGNQSPELLRLIHQNQEQFVRMLNEPIAETTPSQQGGFGDIDDGMGGMPTPQQLQQLMASLSPEQQAQMAAQMGMTTQQLQQFSQMLSQMPPEAVQQMMQQMGGGGGGGGGAPTRIHLTEEEAAAINRLCDMGFDRNEAVQAYLACDKNEALAANFLMDSMSGDYEDNAGGGYGGDSNDDIYG